MKKGRPPLHPLPGATADCTHCGRTFELSTGQRSDIRRGKLQRPCCSNSCQRGANGAKNGKASAAKISAAMRSRVRKSRGLKPGTYPKLMGRHEHRTVAEKMLGRALRPSEVVHHVDGNRHNNAPGNLIVFASQAEHILHHHAIGDFKRGSIK